MEVVIMLVTFKIKDKETEKHQAWGRHGQQSGQEWQQVRAGGATGIEKGKGNVNDEEASTGTGAEKAKSHLKEKDESGIAVEEAKGKAGGDIDTGEKRRSSKAAPAQRRPRAMRPTTMLPWRPSIERLLYCCLFLSFCLFFYGYQLLGFFRTTLVKHWRNPCNKIKLSEPISSLTPTRSTLIFGHMCAQIWGLIELG